MASLKDDVLAGLAKVASPDGAPLTETGTLSDIVASDGKVFFSITVDAGAVPQWEPVRKRAEEAVRAVPGVTSVMVALTAERAGGGAATSQRPQQAPGTAAAATADRAGAFRDSRRRGHHRGGVGQRAASASRPRRSIWRSGCATSGSRSAFSMPIFTGPSLPKLLAIKERPQTVGGTRLKPIARYGLTVMSIGFLIEEETPMIWRGPMVMSALTQMLREVEWGTLDVMVVDMPPGTGDAQLTMAQQVPLKGAVIVSTPQDLALIDARRGIAMFRRVNVPVLGIVENMSYFQCPQCGTRTIFSAMAARATRPSAWACRSSARCRCTWRSARNRTPACRSSRPSRTARTRRSIAISPRACAMKSRSRAGRRRRS